MKYFINSTFLFPKEVKETLTDDNQDTISQEISDVDTAKMSSSDVQTTSDVIMQISNTRTIDALRRIIDSLWVFNCRDTP